jgi:predicted nucleic acid-binding protein
MLRVLRVYADSSVFGGVFDAEFADPSRAFFERIRRGQLRLVISAAVQEELAAAPPEVQALLAEMLTLADLVEITEETRQLRQAYLDAQIVTSRSAVDALHVAQATVSGCAVIVSWNFRHIVHFQRIPLYNAVNVIQGYHAIGIHSPPEIVGDEEQDL